MLPGSQGLKAKRVRIPTRLDPLTSYKCEYVRYNRARILSPIAQRTKWDLPLRHDPIPDRPRQLVHTQRRAYTL